MLQLLVLLELQVQLVLPLKVLIEEVEEIVGEVREKVADKQLAQLPLQMLYWELLLLPCGNVVILKEPGDGEENMEA